MAGEKVDLEKLGMTQEEWDALEEEEQKEKIEELSRRAQESETEKRLKGILADLQDERKRRSISEERVAELEGRIEELEEALEEKVEKEPSSEKDDEWLTLGKAKKVLEEILAKREAEYEGRIADLEASILSNRFKASEDDARKSYSPEKVGEELCYDKVIDNGFAELIKDNPAYKAVVVNSANPAEEAYKIGLTHPNFRDLLKKRGIEVVVEKLSETKVKTGIGSSQGATGLDENTPLEDILKMDDKTLEKYRRTT